MFSKTFTFFVTVLAVAGSALGAPAADASATARGNLTKRCSTWNDAFNTGFNDGYWQAMDQQCHGHTKRAQPHEGKEAESLRKAFAALHAGEVSRRAEIEQRDICGDAYTTGYGGGWQAGTQHCYT